MTNVLGGTDEEKIYRQCSRNVKIFRKGILKSLLKIWNPIKFNFQDKKIILSQMNFFYQIDKMIDKVGN